MSRTSVIRTTGAALVFSIALGVGWAVQPVRAWYAETARAPDVSLPSRVASPDVFGIWTGHSFAYGIQTGPHGAALIDSGSDPSAHAITVALSLRGLAPTDVHTVFLTHGRDEVNAGLACFTRATIWVGAEDRMLARRDVLPKPLLARLRAKSLRQRRLPKLAMQTLWPGQHFAWGTHQAQVIALPGYSWGSFAVLVDGVAFVGGSVHQATTSSVAVAGRAMSTSPTHNAYALMRLHPARAPAFAAIATSYAGVLPVDQATLGAWLDKQSACPLPVSEHAQRGAGALGCTATTAGNG